MSFREDPRLAEAKAMPVQTVLGMLGVEGLRRQSGEMIGPCPLCGGDDRFGVNLRSCGFLCRRCGIKGGDVIGLVQELRGLSFKEALAFLCGEIEAGISDEERERRRRKAEAARRKQEAEAARYRKWAIEDAREIWARSRPGRLGVVRAYLSARGITEAMLPEIPEDLRFIGVHPYRKKIKGQLCELHRGPAMIAAVRNARGDLTAVHQTWVSSTPPHGKASIDAEGESLPAKLVRGSKKGGAIRLVTPSDADTLVMGEGIETTLTAAACWPPVLGPGVAYWAGVDLGNMAGKMIRVEGKQASGIPDMTDREAFVPPPWVKRLIFIQDGDSAPKPTRAKLESGLKRALRRNPGLKAMIVPAGKGLDLNDVLTQGPQDE